MQMFKSVLLYLWTLFQRGVKIVKDFWTDCNRQSDYIAATRVSEANRQWCAYLEANEYPLFTEAVFEALQENATRCGLEQPRSVTQILPPEGRRVGYTPQTGCAFYYIVRRAWTAGIHDGKFETAYGDMCASDMREQLDEVLNAYSRRHGFGSVSVANVQDTGNHRVIVTITPQRGVS